MLGVGRIKMLRSVVRVKHGRDLRSVKEGQTGP